MAEEEKKDEKKEAKDKFIYVEFPTQVEPAAVDTSKKEDDPERNINVTKAIVKLLNDVEALKKGLL